MGDKTAHISPNDLLHAVEQLPPAELDIFVKNIISFQAHRRAKALSPLESDLLLNINVPLAADLLERYRQLVALRREERLTSEEHAELLRLGAAIEHYNSERITWLAELARVRGIPLPQLMDDLDIYPLAV